jgi:hypothetical protein
MKKYKLAFLIAITLSVFSGTLFSQISPSPAPVTSPESSIKSNTFSYIISGLGNATEAADLVILFKSRPEIVDATADYTTHVITVLAPLNMPESDILEVLKFAEKKVINDPKEITKYY